MNKFKFGDKVWHELYGECSVLTLDDEIDNIYKIVYLDGNEDYIAYAHESKLTPASDWVKCSERMPECGDAVLVFNGNFIEIDALEVGEFDFECWCDKITHWMPLPAPPVEVE